MHWFDRGILPILKNYAKILESRLEIERDEKRKWYNFNISV